MSGQAPRPVAGSVSLAYDRIRQAIVDGTYGPGARLVEQRISEEFSLSRTPVREALRRLEADGLVDLRRNRGAVVRSASAGDVRDLYELRARLEAYAAELAAERASPADVETIRAATEAFDGAIGSLGASRASGDVRAVADANARFHGAVVAAARHGRLDRMLAGAVDDPMVLRAFRSFDHGELRRSALFHHLIADAVAGREPARAGHLMTEHVLAGRDRLLAVREAPAG